MEGGEEGCQGSPAQNSRGGGDSVVPFIIIIIIPGLVLPFVRGMDGFASLLHHVHQGTHQPL